MIEEFSKYNNVVHENISDTDSDNGNIDIGGAIPEEMVFIRLELNDNSEYPVTFTDLEEYKKLYPGLDVEQELRNMCGWCNSNPQKRKTKRGIKRFISGWLSRSKKEGSGSSYISAIKNRLSDVDNW